MISDRHNWIGRFSRGILGLACATVMFTSVNGCMLLAAGAAGAGAGYIAGEAADNDHHHETVERKEVIVEQRPAD